MQFIRSMGSVATPNGGPVEGPPLGTVEWVAACYGVEPGDDCPVVSIGFSEDTPWNVDPLNVPCVCGERGLLDPVDGSITTIHRPTCPYLTWQDATSKMQHGIDETVSDDTLTQTLLARVYIARAEAGEE